MAVLLFMGLDVMVSPHMPDSTKKAERDLFAFLSMIWRLPYALRALIWILTIVLPATRVWQHVHCAAGQTLADVTKSEWVGVAIYIIFYALRLWAKATLGSSFTYELAVPEGLVTTGPYAVLVHPSYTGALTSYGVGMLMVCGFRTSVAMALFVLACSFMYATRIADEEAMLRTHFGSSAFDSYLSTRYHLIPFVL